MAKDRELVIHNDQPEESETMTYYCEGCNSNFKDVVTEPGGCIPDWCPDCVKSFF
jgi:hypothetical protein